eukprot:scaffold248697_cov27-Tisochrysis_lutea.AAC.1
MPNGSNVHFCRKHTFAELRTHNRFSFLLLDDPTTLATVSSHTWLWLCMLLGPPRSGIKILVLAGYACQCMSFVACRIELSEGRGLPRKPRQFRQAAHCELALCSAASAPLGLKLKTTVGRRP